MSLPNGMWHGLRNDIIMRNVKYGKWRKEINYTEKHARVFVAPIFGANLIEQPLCRSIYYYWFNKKKAEQKVAVGFTAFMSM